MKPRRDLTPYMGSTENGINATLSLLKVYKRLRTISPEYKPCSKYQARLKHRQAARRMKHGIKR